VIKWKVNRFPYKKICTNHAKYDSAMISAL